VKATKTKKATKIAKQRKRTKEMDAFLGILKRIQACREGVLYASQFKSLPDLVLDATDSFITASSYGIVYRGGYGSASFALWMLNRISCMNIYDMKECRRTMRNRESILRRLRGWMAASS
jgi:hypothetical protein